MICKTRLHHKKLSSLSQVAGVDAHTAAGQPLWRLFARPFADDSPAWEAAVEVAARGDEFILRCCRVADAPERGTFSLQFRSAAINLTATSGLLPVPRRLTCKTSCHDP